MNKKERVCFSNDSRTALVTTGLVEQAFNVLVHG